ncbi:MAG: hypothetical protein ACRDGN_05505 [bacterium]
MIFALLVLTAAVGFAVCVQLIHVMQALLQQDKRVWYRFVVLVPLAIAEALVGLALYLRL